MIVIWIAAIVVFGIVEAVTVGLVSIWFVLGAVAGLLAAVLGGLIGTERGAKGRAAGMRTHIIVCIGAAMTALVGLYTTDVLGQSSDPMRLSAQVISGIGFLGGGMILIRGRHRITGLTTAAGLWTTAAIGLAAGVGFYTGAIAASALLLLTNILLPHIEREKSLTRDVIYAEVDREGCINEFLELMKARYAIDSVRVVAARSNLPGHIGLELDVPAASKIKTEDIYKQIRELPYVAFALEQTD